MKTLPVRFKEIETYGKLLALSTSASQKRRRRVSMNEIINELIEDKYKQLQIDTRSFCLAYSPYKFIRVHRSSSGLVKVLGKSIEI